VGEGGSIARSAIETGEGFSPRIETPHPALRATFSHNKGRRGEKVASLVVMPGLVPGIHVFAQWKKAVDGRVKPGHDSIGVRYGVNLYDTPARTVSMVWRPGLSALETTPGNVDTVDLVGSTPPKS